MPDCEFKKDKPGRVKCAICGQVIYTAFRPELVHARCKLKEKEIKEGPGTDLHYILKTIFRVNYSPGCGCDRVVELMDLKGLDWCKSVKGRAMIRAKLKAEADKRKYPKLFNNRFLINRLLSVSFAYSSVSSTSRKEKLLSRFKRCLSV